MSIIDREAIQQAYIRICRDSGFTLSMDRAAALVSDMLRLGGPLLVWSKGGMTIDTMDQIAEGTHPCLELKKYGGVK